MLRTERAQFLVDNLDLPEAAQFEGAKWEHFQLAHLQDDSMARIENKSRQIAWSWLCAAEAVADGILTGTGSIFQSMNLDEAQEKIRYAKNVINALPVGCRPRLITENKSELEFDNGARLISFPGTPQRGKGQFNIYLDEWAHMQHDREIYTAALPILSKGDGRIRGGSSPMGASGIFWEVFEQELKQYPGFNRKITPWWEVQAFCNDVKAAYREAPAMLTADRVYKFGNDRIVMIYENSIDEDFRQEYEAAFVDETTAWISWDLIRQNQSADNYCLSISSADDIERLIVDVKSAIAGGKIETVLAAGVDIGRHRDLTEIFLVGKATTSQYPLRAMISLANTPYEQQEHCLNRLIKGLPIVKMLIDKNGIGNQLAETLEFGYSPIAEGVNFTNATKELWAVKARTLAEKGDSPIPIDRDLAYQIHSIKKTVTAAKNNVFDTAANEKHHADKFWAWALALWAAAGEARSQVPLRGLPQASAKGWS